LVGPYLPHAAANGLLLGREVDQNRCPVRGMGDDWMGHMLRVCCLADSAWKQRATRELLKALR